MGESSHEWPKRQKVSATQYKSVNTVCEDCGRKWTATLAEVPVTIFIKDLDEYYIKLSKNLLESVEPPMVLCVFTPSDRDPWDTEITLSCVAPRKDKPYHWRINHKHSGPAATSGCQIIPWRDKSFEIKNEEDTVDIEDIVTVKEEIKEEVYEEMTDEISVDPLVDVNPDTDAVADSEHLLPPTLTVKENTEVRKRFVKTTEENITAIKKGRFEDSTHKTTKWGVKIFKDWLKENDLSIQFESLLPSELDSLLARFYVELRKVDGKHYSKVAYTGIRAALQRYLLDPPWNVTYNLLKDGAFFHSNKVLKGVFKTLKEMGVAVVTHYKHIETGDIEKLIKTGVIGTNNPRSLLNLVWLSVSLQIGKKVQGDYRSMTKDTFRRGTDDSGSEFYEYAVCESYNSGRMYARPGDELCPVAAMDKYLSLLHPDLQSLWQKPNDKFNTTGVWFCDFCLGVNTLGSMMKMMSKDAGLSQIYTNHCIKATVSRALGDASFDRADIIKITGHRDVRSLDTYIGVASSSKKRALSDTLSGLTCQGNVIMHTSQGDIIVHKKDHPQYTNDHSAEKFEKEVILNIDDNDMFVS